MTNQSSSRTQGATEFKQIGEILLKNRIERGLDLQSVARALIMSVAQIRGIESAEQAAFHNSSFFLRGIEKYAHYLSIPENNECWSLISQIREAPIHHKNGRAQQSVKVLAKSGLFKNQSSILTYFARHPVFWILMISLAALGINLNSRIETETNRQHELVRQELSAQKTTTESTLSLSPPDQDKGAANQTLSESVTKTEVSALSPKALLDTPQPTPGMGDENNPVHQSQLTDAMPGQSLAMSLPLIQNSQPNPKETRKISLKFSAPSWVKYVVKDGTTQEKIYQPEDVLEIDPSSLESMTIGNTGATTLSAGETPIDLNLYSSQKNGVARLKLEDLNRLAN